MMVSNFQNGPIKRIQRKNDIITPVIMGNPNELDLLMDNFEMSEDTQASIIEKSKTISFENPPTTKAQALKLAEEQFIYCPDIISQGVETIENLASMLLCGNVWYFWWD